MKLNHNWTKNLLRQAADLPAGGSPAPVETAAPVTQEAPAAPDLSWIGADYFSDGKPDFDKFKVHYQDLAAEDARRREAPQAPADGKYDFSMPADLDFGDIKPPEGFEMASLADDPAFAPIYDEFGHWLHAKGLPQTEATALMGLMAKYEAVKASQSYTEAVREFETLGHTDAARIARVASVTRALQGKLSADQVAALQAATSSAAGVKALENLIKASTGPAAPVTQPQAAQLDGLHGSQLLKALATQRR